MTKNEFYKDPLSGLVKIDPSAALGVTVGFLIFRPWLRLNFSVRRNLLFQAFFNGLSDKKRTCDANS